MLMVGLPATTAEAVRGQLHLSLFPIAETTVQSLPELVSALTQQSWDVCVVHDGIDFDTEDVLTLLREDRHDLPCLCLIADADPERVLDLMRGGARDCLTVMDLSRLIPAIERETRVNALRSALHEREQSIRQLLETAPDGVLVLDVGGGIRMANPPMLAMLRVDDPATLLDQPIHGLVQLDQQDYLQAFLDSIMTGAAPPTHTELSLLRLDGDTFPAEISAGTTIWEGRPATQLIIRDASERRQTGERYRRAAGHAEIIARLASRLNAHLELVEVFKVICEEVARGLKAPLVMISLYDNRREEFYQVHDIGLTREVRRQLRSTPRMLYDEVLAPIGPIILFPDPTSFSMLPNAAIYTEAGVRSLVSVSLTRDGQPLGLLTTGITDENHQITQDQITLLRGLADLAAQGISTACLAREARRRQSYLQARRKIEIATSGSLDLRLTLNVILDQVVDHLRVDAADILLLNPSAQALECAASRGFRSSLFQRYRVRLGEGYAGRAAHEQRPISVPVLPNGKADFGQEQRPVMAGEEFAAYHNWPLLARGQIKGVLEILHRQPLDPDSEWQSFLEALAAQAAIAIDNAALFNDLQRTNVDLALAYDATIEGWARTLELRDHETEGHTQRVTDLTVRLSQVLGVNKADIGHIRRGALLHDIGKMAIPDNILRKPSPLSEEEWAIMRMHPVYAYNLLSPITFLRPAIDIPYSHHEKWDGTGYPQGLRERQIPLAARIFAVTDIWDALRSDRPYRASWPEARISRHIESLAGAHLDPEIVEAFLTLMRTPRSQTGVTDLLRSL